MFYYIFRGDDCLVAERTFGFAVDLVVFDEEKFFAERTLQSVEVVDVSAVAIVVTAIARVFVFLSGGFFKVKVFDYDLLHILYYSGQIFEFFFDLVVFHGLKILLCEDFFR